MADFTFVPNYNEKYNELRVDVIFDGRFYKDINLPVQDVKIFTKAMRDANKLGHLPTNKERVILGAFVRYGFAKWSSYTQIEYTEIGLREINKIK
tara:strand:- start:1127 stop:1411 length:285 start_codon:yes stop_codon:yes gene_type:complete